MPRQLNAEQEGALEKLANVNAAKRKIQTEGFLELKIELARRTAAIEQTEALQVAECLRLNVPKVQINQRGLRTTNPVASDRVMAKFSNVNEANLAIRLEAQPPYAWEDSKHTIIRVSATSGYPGGLIELDDKNVPRVIADDEARSLQAALVTSNLRVELAQFAGLL